MLKSFYQKFSQLSLYSSSLVFKARFVMIFKSFLLGNLVSLCMKIINSVIGVRSVHWEDCPPNSKFFP